MTDSDETDDAMLVDNEINRCLDLAGDRLHADDMPDNRWNRKQDPDDYWGGVISSITTSSTVDIDDLRHRQARFYLDRVALLDRLGTRRAAAYLRKELLDAIGAQRADGDSATLAALGFTKPGSMVLNPPQAITVTPPVRVPDWRLQLENTYLRQWRAVFHDEFDR